MKDVVFLVNICINCRAVLLKTMESFQSKDTYIHIIVVYMHTLHVVTVTFVFCFQFHNVLNLAEVTEYPGDYQSSLRYVTMQ